VIPLRRLQLTSRLLLAAVLALCLGVRLLTPAGFMPSFAGGSLAIVECPDARIAPPPPPIPAMHHMAGMAMHGVVPPAHDHDKNAFHHQPCPYAAAASLAGIDVAGVALALLVLFSALPPQARALLAFRRGATRDRPPSQAPPLPA
jgi:hypothetical protein